MEIGVSTFEALVLAGSVVGVYMRVSSDLGKLKSRVIALEREKGKVEHMLSKVIDEIQEIKILLARKNIDG